MSSKAQNEGNALIDTNDEGTGRIEAFSDGVIAIAITLLVLDIKVPHLDESPTANLAAELLKLWPSYGGYLTSFLVIGIIWINHHQMYKLIQRTDHAFLALNVIFLMVVSFLPFPTALLAEYLREGRDQQVATIVYAGSMLLMALIYNILWRYAAKGFRLINPGTSPTILKDIMQKYNTGSLLYVIAFVLAFISYQVSLGLIVLLALYFLIPGWPNISKKVGRHPSN
jgi:uncharacterized membrane protein